MLSKLEIHAFTDSMRQLSQKQNSCSAMYNPESVNISYSIEWQEEQGLGKSDSPIRYINNNPEKISFKLIFSDVGVEELGIVKIVEPIKPVYTQVQEFLRITTKNGKGKDGDMGRPYYLELHWGQTFNNDGNDYPCQLSSVDVTYTQFDRAGNPLRAELDVEFTEDQRV